MTHNEAVDFSLVKWKYIKNTGCTCDDLEQWVLDNHNDIFYRTSSCGLCQKYDRCITCPLFKLWGITCYDKKSIFKKWQRAKIKRTRKKYATIMYNEIASLRR